MILKQHGVFYIQYFRYNQPSVPTAVGNSDRHPLESSMASKSGSLKESSSSSYYPSVGGYPARRPTGVDMALGLSGYAVKVSFSFENVKQYS